MKLVIALVLVALLSGCATTIPINYIPSTFETGSGSVEVGKFTYEPFLKGKVKENQIQKCGPCLGEKYTNGSVASIVQDALKKELVHAGYTLQAKSNVLVTGEVTHFYNDWTGFTEVDFDVKITFRILQNGKQVFTYAAHAHEKAPKNVIQNSEALRQGIATCITDFIAHAKAAHVL